MDREESRRRFLKRMGAGAAALVAAGGSLAYGTRLFQPREEPRGEGGRLATRTLGRTGVSVSILGMGGEARVEQPQVLPLGGAVEIIERAIDLGVNYIDTSAYYGRGTSERNIGRVLRRRRDEVILATKSHDRTYDGTMRLAEQSLSNLQTDRIDIYQIHDVRTDDQVERILAQDGAVRAAERLRAEGVIRFIGITGHYDAQVLVRAIERYDFDTILLPLNAADIHHHPFQNELLDTAVRKDMGILAMKVFGKGQLLREGGITTTEQALGYVLSFPVATAVVGISSREELEDNIRTAASLTLPLEQDELVRLEWLSRNSAQNANWFKRQV